MESRTAWRSSILRTRQGRGGLAAGCLLAGFVLLGPVPARPAPAASGGRSLEAALQSLRDQGLRLVYSSRLVRPSMRVVEEPAAGDPRVVLDQLLKPHGLEAVESVGGRIVVTAAKHRPPSRLEKRPPSPPAPPPPEEIPQASDEIEVTSSWPSLTGRGLSTTTLEGRTIDALPRLGGDVFRAAAAMPGATGTDRSAGLRIRGGRQDEVMVRLDGLELVEPFHLQDANDALGLPAPGTIAHVELVTGGLSVEYGDRMGGVLDLTTVAPSWRRRTDVELSSLQGQASSSGTFEARPARWLASARKGTLEFPFEIADREESPGFWDGFAKLDYSFDPRHSLRGNVLAAEDWLEFSDFADPEAGAGDAIAEQPSEFRTGYRNTYSWLHHQALLNGGLVVEGRASATHLERDRRGRGRLAGGDFVLSDGRDVKVTGLGQDWRVRFGRAADDDRVGVLSRVSHTVRAGFDLRSLRVAYDYANDRVLSDPLAAIRDRPRAGATRFVERFSGRQLGLYVADRIELDRWALDLGLRFDEHTLVDDQRFSPRVSFVGPAGARGRVRAAWGNYAQSQRLYELQVADGETAFSRPELGEHWNLGFEHDLAPAGRKSLWTASLRAEVYRRRIARPRARFENVFEPISLIPELEADRIRIAPERSLSQGLEILLEGGVGRRSDWSLGYTLASTEDLVDGRFIPRNIDQRHDLDLQVGYRTPWRWDARLAWRYHSGWPTTAITARQETAEDGSVEILPTLGPLYDERLPAYHRVDLRLSRRWSLPPGELTFFVNVQNLTDRDNARGFDVRFTTTADGQVQALRDPEVWTGRVFEVGARWRF